jgi:DNA-binding PadR family transcriptional regulator
MTRRRKSMSPQPLAEFELLVMLATARVPEAYGASIRREIESRTDRDVSIGALYATLSRLEDKGMLRSGSAEPRPVPGGRARKLYHLTPGGVEAVRKATDMVDRLREGLDWSSVEVRS